MLTAVGVLRAYAAITPEYPFESTRPSATGGTVTVSQLPVGVVGAMIPSEHTVVHRRTKARAGAVRGLHRRAEAGAGRTVEHRGAHRGHRRGGSAPWCGQRRQRRRGHRCGTDVASRGGQDQLHRVHRVGAQIAATCGSQIRRCSTELAASRRRSYCPTAAGVDGGRAGRRVDGKQRSVVCRVESNHLAAQPLRRIRRRADHRGGRTDGR